MKAIVAIWVLLALMGAAVQPMAAAAEASAQSASASTPAAPAPKLHQKRKARSDSETGKLLRRALIYTGLGILCLLCISWGVPIIAGLFGAGIAEIVSWTLYIGGGMALLYGFLYAISWVLSLIAEAVMKTEQGS